MALGYAITVALIIGILRLIGYLLNKINDMSYQTAKYVQYTFLFFVFCAILNSWLSI